MQHSTEYLERSNETMLELINKKDELINRLQEEVAEQSRRVTNMRLERNNLINEVKEYVIESISNGEMSDTIAETLAQICDFELTTEVTATVRVEYEIQMSVPIGEDAESMLQDIDFETVSYNSDYISWFNAEVGSITIENNS
jgi:DNA-binding TFAR19-related protein (PDSD5 family)